MGLYKFALKHLNVKNCYFIYTHGLLNSNRNIDLTKIIPQFASVIQTAIILSIYLGFKEIKLSGVDMTNFLSLINEQSAYAFDMKKDILLDKYKKSKTFDNHSFLQGIAYMFRDFKLIYSYCLRKNIYIQNCSTPTVLDSIPRGNPEDLYD
jgi:predicted transporter